MPLSWCRCAGRAFDLLLHHARVGVVACIVAHNQCGGAGCGDLSDPAVAAAAIPVTRPCDVPGWLSQTTASRCNLWHLTFGDGRIDR
jgi:hypothetical protein